MKIYNEKFNVGTTRYLVSYHDGVKKHRDGSDFYDVSLFGNRRAKDMFIKDLQRQGYIYGSPLTPHPLSQYTTPYKDPNP